MTAPRPDEWDRAFHAYGPARGGDVLLEVLRRGVEEAHIEEHPDAIWWQQPYVFLWSALYRGGRITPATVLGLRYLTEAVTADDFGGADQSLLPAVLSWLRDVSRAALAGPDPGDQPAVSGAASAGADLNDARRVAARRDEPAVTAWLDEYLRTERSILEWTDSDEPGRILLAAARVDCVDFLPHCFEAVSVLLAPHHPDNVRAAAASAAASLVGHPELRRHRDEMIAYHAREARHGAPHHRASMVVGLGELGGVTRPWLDDPELGVRVCAALAPGLAGDPAAFEVLRDAALDLTRLDPPFAGSMYLHQRPDLGRAVTEALRPPATR
ncbi:hypothetical protein M1L60_08000 [Actinoplanes sp. TRM 88003]|uniref:HEAT repeat domain-containing protein n=1 Tax=Paractinoplanes aksuensis TaxID=2939490 RepID=A0ABT1DJ92_9ACTN|nr:hypothetical protein [Actinoplanes aksuensis]MCO8270538.1 hypothetical protein [Actinoplanes aksuensis]